MKISPRYVIGALTAALAWSFAHSTSFPMDDHFHYQAFINALSQGNLDLSIPGFHGSDILATIWHVFDSSPVSQIHFQIFCAIALPFIAFHAGRVLFDDDWQALLLSCVIALMPFLSFVALRGWTGPAYMVLMLASIIYIQKNSLLAAAIIALAILTKPFAIALLPLLYVLCDAKERKKMLTIALAVPAVYVLLQIAQTGGVIVGSHTDVSALSVWQGPQRIFLNLAHAVQILFSVHNYYFVDPALTGPGNMMHTTPVLIFLGLLGLLSSGKRSSVQSALLFGAAIGIGLNALHDHMDHFYMQAGILCLILAAIPMLKKYPVWVPIVLATLHFQWLYFFLEYREPFALDATFFAVPVVIDLIFCFGFYKRCIRLRAT